MQELISAVFLDRDGVINEENGYASNAKDARLLPGVAAAVRVINERSIPVVVVSNQAGIARGYHTEADTKAFNAALARELERDGAHIDGWYFCPHHPDGKGAYAKVCDCRKPMPGLLHRAAKDMDLDLLQSVMVGDKATDLQAGRTVGCKTVLVMTGHGAKEWEAWSEEFKPDHIAADLAEATDWLLNR